MISTKEGKHSPLFLSVNSSVLMGTAMQHYREVNQNCIESLRNYFKATIVNSEFHELQSAYNVIERNKLIDKFNETAIITDYADKVRRAVSHQILHSNCPINEIETFINEFNTGFVDLTELTEPVSNISKWYSGNQFGQSVFEDIASQLTL